jgi:hypothetical protein
VSLDTVAFREDSLAAAQASGRALERLQAMAGRIRPERLAAVQAAQDGAKAVEFMTELLAGCSKRPLPTSVWVTPTCCSHETGPTWGARGYRSRPPQWNRMAVL